MLCNMCIISGLYQSFGDNLCKVVFTVAIPILGWDQIK